MTVNVTLILQDGRTCTNTLSSAKKAAEWAVKTAADSFYTERFVDGVWHPNPVERVFFGYDNLDMDLEEHTLAKLKRDLANGIIPSDPAW